jgi:hypothetical protein
LAGTLLFDEKICQSAARFWFGLRNVKVLHSQAAIQRTIDVPPKFLEHGSAKKIAVWAHATVIRTSRRLVSFLHEAAQNSYQIFKIKN